MRMLEGDHQLRLSALLGGGDGWQAGKKKQERHVRLRRFMTCHV